MPLHCRTSHMFLLLCAFSLWAESVKGGTSFLSPDQRPQSVKGGTSFSPDQKPHGRGDRKPPRMGRRDTTDPEIPVLKENDAFMVVAPFELGVSLSEAEYEKYGSVLQKILANVLSNSPTE